MIKHRTSSTVYKIPEVSGRQATEETEKWYSPDFIFVTSTLHLSNLVEKGEKILNADSTPHNQTHFHKLWQVKTNSPQILLD